MICNLFDAPTYLLYSPEVPQLLYYAYLPTIIVSLLLGFYVLINGRKLLLNKLLFAISLSFFAWTILILIAWTNIYAGVVAFAWTFFGPILGLTAILTIYFTYVFINGKDVLNKIKFVFLLLISPLLLLAPTSLNIHGFDISLCDAFQFEWWPYKIYSGFIGLIAFVWISILLFTRYLKVRGEERLKLSLLGSGILLMIFMFYGMEFTGTYLTKIGLVPDSGIEIFGMFGVVIFIIYMNVLIVRFSAFNIKMIATKALVLGLTALVGSQFFFIENETIFILNVITFVSALVLGYFLIKSVNKEVAQRVLLTQQKHELENANARLDRLNKEKTEFISLATHQIRAPLSAIKGYASMMLEGDFGPISDETKDAVSTMYTSAHNLVSIVGDYLDISRLDLNRLKFNLDTFDVSEAIDAIVREQQPNLRGKELSLTYAKADTMPDKVSIKADVGKIKQAIGNLIDNAIKYTPRGSVAVTLGRAETMLGYRIMISDTGVGIPAETLPKLFKRFSRADDAHTVNVQGTGLGLYLVRKMIETHGGKVWAESDGKDKGSRFIIELPIEARIKEGVLAEGEEGEVR